MKADMVRSWSLLGARLEFLATFLLISCFGEAHEAFLFDCGEPMPVPNAYRWWSPDDGHVHYECFHTYVFTEGDLYRECNSSTGKYEGLPPVCLLNCTEAIREESAADVIGFNGSLALDQAWFQCQKGFVGDSDLQMQCQPEQGAWNNPVIDCHYNYSIILNVSTDPLINATDDYEFAIDSNEDTYVTLNPGSSLTFNLVKYGERMEVTRVEVTLMVNTTETIPACRLTELGTEYSGSQSSKAANVECQAWTAQQPNKHSYDEDDMFPADGSVDEAENFCRNPNASKARPWCYLSTKPSFQLCDIAACVQLKLETVYVSTSGILTPDACSDQGGRSPIHDIFTETLPWEQPVTKTFTCRNSDLTNRINPFGHQLKVTFLTPYADLNVTLNLHEVKAFGRPYIGGCGPVVGYWGLEPLPGQNLTQSWPGSEVQYQCHPGWHYRGGTLSASCTDLRSWTQPDLTQCTDAVNYAEIEETSKIALVDGNVTTCIVVQPQDHEVTVKTNGTLEISEVVVTIDLGTTDSVASLDRSETTVKNEVRDREWPCPMTTSGQRGTYTFSCPFRPVADRVTFAFHSTGTTDWSICEIKVFGRPFTSAVECLQTSKGQEYKGQWSRTTSGRECLRWDLDESMTSSLYFPDVDIYDAHNFCRNPANEADGQASKLYPWCYLAEKPVDWEYCPLFQCDEMCRLREDGVNYQGEVSASSSGSPCQGWGSSSPADWLYRFQRSHYYQTPWSKECRNPHASHSVPWCYVAGQPQSCDIPLCPLANQTAFTLLEPEGNNSAPWLNDPELTVRKCWEFPTSDFSKDRTSLDPVKTECSRSLNTIGTFCHLEYNNASVWHYFWYNCTFPEEESTTITTTTTALATTTIVTSSSTTTSSSPVTSSVVTTTSPGDEMTSGQACQCRMVCNVNLTSAELQELVKQIKKELQVDTQQLSATIRKKISAPDNRPSSITTGAIGIVFIAVVIGFIVSADLLSAVHAVWKIIKNYQTGTNKTRVIRMSN